MHELSVAYHLVQLVTQLASQHGGGTVVALHVRLGVLCCVHREALEFCYELAAQGTCAENARLIIEEVPVEVYCSECQQQFQLQNIQKFSCPRCGKPTADIRRGKELELVSVELEDQDPLESKGDEEDSQTQQRVFS